MRGGHAVGRPCPASPMDAADFAPTRPTPGPPVALLILPGLRGLEGPEGCDLFPAWAAVGFFPSQCKQKIASVKREERGLGILLVFPVLVLVLVLVPVSGAHLMD